MTAEVLRREPPPAPADATSRGLAERVFRIRESGIVVVLALFIAVTAGLQHRFLSASNIQFVLVNTVIFALLALGYVVYANWIDPDVGRPSLMVSLVLIVLATGYFLALRRGRGVAIVLNGPVDDPV